MSFTGAPAPSSKGCGRKEAAATSPRGGWPVAGGSAGSTGPPRWGLRRSTETVSSRHPRLMMKNFCPASSTLYSPWYRGPRAAPSRHVPRTHTLPLTACPGLRPRPRHMRPALWGEGLRTGAAWCCQPDATPLLPGTALVKWVQSLKPIQLKRWLSSESKEDPWKVYRPFSSCQASAQVCRWLQLAQLAKGKKSRP